jgi:UDP-glucose:(heptosyl)LPS alpha-1,3-glucosyltransferase
VRAAITIENFRPGPGGVESVAWQLARELGERGVDLTVLCRQAAKPAPPGVRIETLGGVTFWQPLRVLDFSRRAARGTASGAFDVVQAFSRTRHQDVYRAGGGSHAAYMESVYAHPRLLARFSPRHRSLLAIEEAVFRDASQTILCNSKLVAGDLAQRYGLAPARLAVIYNGVDLERFHPRMRERNGARVRGELGLDGPIALFVGSGFARKGLDRAIAGLAAAGAKADLVVAGGGDPSVFRRQAEALGIGGRVHFLGVRNDVADLYAAADLFVLPTRYDPFANVCLEAMAAGVAVATTTRNGAAELLESGVNGFVCEEDFAPAFRALEDPARLREMAARAREVAERLSWREHASAVLGLWQRVREQRGGQRELVAALRAGATPPGVTVLKRNRVRVVARSGDTLLKVLFERPRNASREARALIRAEQNEIRAPELIGSGPDWIATRFLGSARPAQRSDHPAIVEATARAHAKGFLHGDLHLGNLLVDERGVVFLDLQKARFLPWLPHWLRSWELGYLAYSLGEPLPAELAHVRFWRDRRARTHWDSRTRRCVQESGGFTTFRFEGAKGFRRRDADEAALQRALGSLGTAKLIKDAANGRLLRSGTWILKEHASARAARRAWLGGSGLEARGFATGRALAWVGRWLVMEDRGATLDAWVRSDFALADAAQRAELAARLGSLLAALHRRGVYHADLKANNIVWSPGSEPRLLDYGCVDFGARVSRRRRVKNLAQLNAALPDEVPGTLREAALARYLAESGYRDDTARLRRDVIAESLRRSHLWHGC